MAAANRIPLEVDDYPALKAPTSCGESDAESSCPGDPCAGDQYADDLVILPEVYHFEHDDSHCHQAFQSDEPCPWEDLCMNLLKVLYAAFIAWLLHSSWLAPQQQ